MRRFERICSITVIAAILVAAGGWLGFKLTRWRDRSQPHETTTSTVIRQVQTLADLVTVKYVVEKVVILNAPPESTLGQFVQGDNRVLLLAHGVVKAGIDLKQLTPADVSVSGKSIRIKLPPAQITDAYLDDSLTKVIDWKQGFLRSFDKDLEQTARQMAVDDIRRAARTDGILNEAGQRAMWQLAVFFRNAGFEHIEFPGQSADGTMPLLLAAPKN
ncbi:MAG TPA: DUF4230 domain-containing protein [Verrucomicrobiae bacterium]